MKYLLVVGLSILVGLQICFAEDHVARPVIISNPNMLQQQYEEQNKQAEADNADFSNPFLMQNFIFALESCISGVSIVSSYGKSSVLGYEDGQCHVYLATDDGLMDCFIPREALASVARTSNFLKDDDNDDDDSDNTDGDNDDTQEPTGLDKYCQLM